MKDIHTQHFPLLVCLVAVTCLMTAGLTADVAEAKKSPYEKKAKQVKDLNKKIANNEAKIEKMRENGKDVTNPERLAKLQGKIAEAKATIASIQDTVILELNMPAESDDESEFYSTTVRGPLHDLTVVQDYSWGYGDLEFDVQVVSDDPRASVTCDPQSGAAFLNGITTVTCEAFAPGVGKTHTETFTVTVTAVPTTIEIDTERGILTGNTLTMKAFEGATHISFNYQARALSDATFYLHAECNLPEFGTPIPVGETTTLTCISNNGVTRSVDISVVESGATTPAFTPTVTLPAANATIPWIESMTHSTGFSVGCWQPGVGGVTAATTFAANSTVSLNCFSIEAGPSNPDFGYHGIILVTIPP